VAGVPERRRASGLRHFDWRKNLQPQIIRIVPIIHWLQLEFLPAIQRLVEMWLPHWPERVAGDVQADGHAGIFCVPPFHAPSALFVLSAR
jgi:hypothetical protein